MKYTVTKQTVLIKKEHDFRWNAETIEHVHKINEIVGSSMLKKVLLPHNIELSAKDEPAINDHLNVMIRWGNSLSNYQKLWGPVVLSSVNSSELTDQQRQWFAGHLRIMDIHGEKFTVIDCTIGGAIG